MDIRLVRVLTHLTYFSNGLDEKRLIDDVLKECKNVRKKLSKENILIQGYNIYEKRDANIHDLIEYALSHKIIKKIRANTYEYAENLVLTKWGEDCLKNAYSKDYCYEYIQYRAELNRLMNEKQKPLIKEMQIMKMFWNNKDVYEMAKFYGEWQEYEVVIRKYQEYILNNCGYDNDYLKGKYIFNLFPRLFVPFDYMNSKVSLEIEGIDIPKNLIVLKPYPNRRYYIGGLSFKNEKSAIGFYPIIKSKEDFPKNIAVKLIWGIDKKLKIIHNIDINFNFTNTPGNLFSTYQVGSMCYELNNVETITTFPEETAFTKDERNIKYKISENGELIEIFEKVTLNNFPLEMQRGINADKYFDKFEEKNE